MSIAEDEYMSVLNKFHRRGVLAIDVGKSGSYRVLPTLAGHISRAADIIAHEVIYLRRLDLEADTIEDGSFGIGKCIIEDEIAIYIIDAREPEIGVRFEGQIGTFAISLRRSIASPLFPSTA